MKKKPRFMTTVVFKKISRHLHLYITYHPYRFKAGFGVCIDPIFEFNLFLGLVGITLLKPILLDETDRNLDARGKYNAITQSQDKTKD